MILPVILWTDALVFLLLISAGIFAWHTSRKDHLLAPWSRVIREPVAVGAGMLLSVFVIIGVLDSLHFRLRVSNVQGVLAESGSSRPGDFNWSPEVTSALDILLRHLSSRQERTYSAPLATHAFSRETVDLPGGGQAREFPRLRFGGAHLDDPENSRIRDIFVTVLRGLALALISWCALSVVLLAIFRSNRYATLSSFADAIWEGGTEFPWRTILGTLLAFLLIAAPVGSLSMNYHVLGTDKVGQDVLYLSLKSIRTALVIGTLTTLVTMPFAIFFGIAAGYFRGWVDDIIQYVYTTLNSIPSVLLIAAAVLVLQAQMEARPEMFSTSLQRADTRLLFLCIILGITTWTGLCRLLRGETMKLRELDYVQAARSFGVSHAKIMLRHILPNVMHVVLISVVMEFSGLVLAEAVLSYVGVGVDPTMNSFGTMINAARLEMGREPMVWWSLASAFFFMLALVLAANLVADSVRDAFDPRLRPRANPVAGAAVAASGA